MDLSKRSASPAAHVDLLNCWARDKHKTDNRLCGIHTKPVSCLSYQTEAMRCDSYKLGPCQGQKPPETVGKEWKRTATCEVIGAVPNLTSAFRPKNAFATHRFSFCRLSAKTEPILAETPCKEWEGTAKTACVNALKMKESEGIAKNYNVSSIADDKLAYQRTDNNGIRNTTLLKKEIYF